MIDMSTWEELIVDVVDDVQLDPRNVRLESVDGAPESDIIQDLFSNEKAFSLVEGIAKVGLLTHEVPIVVYRGGSLIIVEGNRRIAALKAIQNPYLTPEFQARISKLAKLIPSREKLRRVTVKVAPSQDDADQLIAALHTGSQRLAWSPSRQAAFFQAQIDGGKTTKQLVQQYPTVNVMKFVVRSRILDLFRTVRYADPALKDHVQHRRKFSVSTLARLYDNEKFLDLVGIQVDESAGTAVLAGSKKVFKQVAEKIVADIKAKKINTRVLNSTQNVEYRQYMDALRELIDRATDAEAAEQQRKATAVSGKPTGGAPPTNNPPAATSSEPGGSAGSSNTGNGANPTPSTPTDSPSTAAAKAQPTPAKLNFLSTANISVSTTLPPSVHAIATEVGTINIARFPNAAMDLLRTFLEKSIKAYAESIGVDIRKETNANGYVYLSNSLTWLEKHLNVAPENKAFVQVVNKIRNNKISAYSAQTGHLNAINHNHHIFATPDDVRECWNAIEGLMRVILK